LATLSRTVKGNVAWAIQRLATRVGERAFCFSHLHERRLRADGFRGPIVIGVYAGPLDRPVPEPSEALVVFVGHHIPEKACWRSRRRLPERGRSRPSCVPRSSATDRFEKSFGNV
jgi:hypothetical protein